MNKFTVVLVFCILCSIGLSQDEKKDGIIFTPINHATFVIQTQEKTIIVDPVGDVENYSKFSSPDLILITHTHGDHMSQGTVDALKSKKTIIVAPEAVVNELKEGEILNNGEKKEFSGVEIEAIPMYNLTKERAKYHEKGQGNGYVVTLNKNRIYISGDTEDIPEMRNLKDINYAFVCMNLPYTMTVEQAASAVLEMKPAVVYPYHYRGQGGMSDIEKFKQLVSKNKEIKVRLLDWYN
jgi:L-ascorbate metabolism protein UlaG (beta-lactamase superfamily)